MRDPHELSLHLSLTAGHDRVVVVAQDANEVPRVDARRRPERGYCGRGVALVRKELQVDRLEPATRRAREVAVAADDRLEAFFGEEPQRFLEGDEDRDGWRRRGLRLLERGLVRGEVEVRLGQIRLLVCLPRP